MKALSKKFSKLDGKKRYIVMGLLGLELLSLPAAAQIIQRVAFEPRPLVTAVKVPTAEPGLSRFLVTSDAGFDIRAENVVGRIETTVYVSGTISGSLRFGDAAQLPGPKAACAQLSGSNSHIYKADSKTEAGRGSPAEQAVIFEFSYPVDSHPNFKFIADGDSAETITSCSDERS